MEGLSSSINLLVLPVLGGYWFQYKFIGTHYRAERLTPQRLVFHAGLFALGLIITAKLLVFVGDSQARRGNDWLGYLLFSVLPAFIMLVLACLVAAGLHRYPVPEKSDLPPMQSIRLSQRFDALLSPNEELWRAVLGGLLAAVLVILSSKIVAVARSFPSTETRVDCVAVVASLLTISWMYQRFVNRYVDFPFYSIALRIGMFGVIASLALTIFFTHYTLIGTWWDQFVHLQGSGIPMLACLLGLVLWWPLNLLYPHQAANLRLHEKQATTALDRLLYQASLEQHLLSISMKDGKVYIGYIQQLPPNPEDRSSYFEILPVHSGYRDKDTRELTLTTFYEGAFQKLVETKAGPDEWLAFIKVMKIDDIVSSGRFDPDVYVQMQEEAEAEEVPVADHGKRG